MVSGWGIKIFLIFGKGKETMINILGNIDSAFISEFNKPKNIVILTHVNPDGDAMGSSLALYQYLVKKGNQVTVITPNDYPAFLKWMKGSDQVVEFKSNSSKACEILKKADLLICADFNELSRLKGVNDYLQYITAKRLLIDHHLNPESIYDHAYHTIQTSSTAELVYRFISDMNEKHLIDKDIAECIYAGIMTDTGCFSFNSSTPRTFNIVSDLLQAGIDKDKVFSQVYNNYSANRMRLMGYALQRKMVVHPDIHTAYIVLSRAELESFEFAQGDTEGFVNLPFNIAGIHFTALFLERKEGVKVSLRSHGSFPVNELCKKHYMGGGHKNAAGGETKLPLDEAVDEFEKLLIQYSNDLKTATWS